MIALRPYQLAAIDATRSAFASGATAPLIVSPTGSGKTAIAAEILRLHVARGGRPIWLTHRAELAEQAYDALARAGVACDVLGDGIARERATEAQCTVAMLQTMLARDVRPHATLAIIDECHHAAADEFLGAVTHYPVRIGLSATPERADRRGLRCAFDTIIVAATIRELTDRGHLVPCEVIAPSRKLDPGELAQHPVDAYAEHASGRRTIAFAPCLAEARSYVDTFVARGIAAAMVSGDMPTDERRAAIELYRSGAISVLVNVYVLTEGFDDPSTSCCILARGCGSPGMYLQIVGRILRPCEGKTSALLIDLRGAVHDHGEPDVERIYSLDGKAIRRKTDDGLRFCEVCGYSLGVGETVCPQCKWERESGATLQTVVGVQLEKFARKRAESEDQRAETLARWICSGRERGYKSGWAMARYRAVYGDWPSHTVKRNAESFARGAA